MDIKIRKLLPNESNSYRELRLQCLKTYPQHFSSNYQDEKRKEKLFFQPCIETCDTNNFVIGAFHESKLIGISGFNRYEKNKISHIGIIIQVYVTPEYQGKQIGFNLVKSTLSEAFKINGIEQIEIGVISSNKNADKIYANLGFETFGIQKHYLKIDNHYYDHKMMMIFKNQFLKYE